MHMEPNWVSNLFRFGPHSSSSALKWILTDVNTFADVNTFVPVASFLQH